MCIGDERRVGRVREGRSGEQDEKAKISGYAALCCGKFPWRLLFSFPFVLTSHFTPTSQNRDVGHPGVTGGRRLPDR